MYNSIRQENSKSWGFSLQQYLKYKPSEYGGNLLLFQGLIQYSKNVRSIDNA
jgi:hypothetical protein